MKLYFILLAVIALSGCKTVSNEQQMEIWKNEVSSTESAFAEVAKNEGIQKAFVAFADSNAVLLRRNSLVKGIQEIEDFYSQQDLSNVELSWSPDFIEVAASGDLAYTYGAYIYSVTDSLGNKSESKGIFHTVWKRQTSGEWRFVWD